MTQKLYIGNLPYRATEEDIRKLFSDFEPIYSLVLISDRETGRSRGFGFIEIDEKCADEAIQVLGDKLFGGRNLRISKARNRIEPYHVLSNRPQPVSIHNESSAPVLTRA